MNNQFLKISYHQILSYRYYDEYLNLIDDIFLEIKNKNQMNEERVWNDAEIMNNDIYYKNYISCYPKGKYVTIAKTRLGQNIVKQKPILSDELAWNDAEIMNNDTYYKNYISQFPNGKYVIEAKKRINK